MTSQTLDPYRSIRISTTNWAKIASSYVLGKFIYEIAL